MKRNLWDQTVAAAGTRPVICGVDDRGAQRRRRRCFHGRHGGGRQARRLGSRRPCLTPRRCSFSGAAGLRVPGFGVLGDRSQTLDPSRRPGWRDEQEELRPHVMDASRGHRTGGQRSVREGRLRSGRPAGVGRARTPRGRETPACSSFGGSKEETAKVHRREKKQL